MTTTHTRNVQTGRAMDEDRMIPRSPTLVVMPFEDAEEERLWDEIVEARASAR